jgi:uncharacterized protein with von Willebrand factor type A (vWA) domain
VWKNTGFEILKQYDELLKKDTLLQELAEMLGRMRKAEKEYEQELYAEMVLTPAFKIDYAHKSEYVGIHESADLSSILPSELALLSDSATEMLFYKKMAEKKLMTWEYQTQFLSTKEIEQENTRQKAKERDKGPIIICVDTSGSMHGTPEYVAKVLCFTMVKIALNDNRKCYLISFSTKIETLELTDLGQSLDKLVAFLQMSFQGGTDATPALHQANQMLQTANYQKADVLMISDFIMNALALNVASAMQIQKENGTKFHSLSICSQSNSAIINTFDNNWIYDTNDTQSLKRLVTNFRSM